MVDEAPQVETTTTPEAAATPAEATPSNEVEYVANGQTIREPLQMALKRASQGYNYSQQMSDFNRQKSDFDRTRTEHESRYKHLDDYARENPEWYQHWSQAYDNRFSQTPGTQTDAPVDPAMAQKMAQLEQQQGQFSQFVQDQQRQAQDQKYWSDFEAIHKQYPDVNLNQIDGDSGKTMEQQVLEFMQENGMAQAPLMHGFRAFHHDKLIDMATAKAKEGQAKGIQADRKAGIMGTSPTPTQTQPGSLDVRRHSYDQLAELAKQELRKE